MRQMLRGNDMHSCRYMVIANGLIQSGRNRLRRAETSASRLQFKRYSSCWINQIQTIRYFCETESLFRSPSCFGNLQEMGLL